MVAIVGIADEKSAHEFLFLLCRGLLLTAGAVNCNVDQLPTLVTLSWLIGVCGVASTPVVAFLVEDLSGPTGLACCILIAGNSGCSMDAAQKFSFLMFLGKCVVGVLIAATRLGGFEGVYHLGVEPIVLDAAVQGGLLELLVHAAAEPGNIIPDPVKFLTEVDNIAVD